MRPSRAGIALLRSLVLLALLIAPASAHADTVTDWNLIAASALQDPAATGGAGQGAVSTAHLAMVHGAVYDAVNAIDGTHEPYLCSPPAKRWYSKEAAVATAAYRVLTGSVPALGVTAARRPAVDAAYAAALAAIADGRAKAGGVATGEAAAAAMIAARAGDGRFGPFRFTIGALPGEWRPFPPGSTNDPGAWLKDVTPFVLRHPHDFRGRPPHGLKTRAYAAELAEVQAIGSATSTLRTPAQTAAAQYWGTTNATATMASVMRSVATTQGGGLAESARMFASTYANAADALIVTWRDKARYSWWRPIHAIREAGADRNPATSPDATWTPLIAAPPYPEHPSGLSAFGGAVAQSLQDFYDTDRVVFSGTTPAGVAREFRSFSQLRDDIVDARVWSGIHFRFSDEEGAKIGRRVARWGGEHAFRRGCSRRHGRSGHSGHGRGHERARCWRSGAGHR